MKHFKLPAIILLLLMVLSVFGQRGMGSSSSGRSSSFSSSSGRSSSSFSSGRSFSSPSSSWSSTRSSGYKPSNPATAPRSNLSSNWKSGSAYSRPQTTPRSSTPPRTTVTSSARPTTRVSVTSNYRVGYRPPTTVRYYGNPYRYNNTSIYWYGGGYYSTYVGGPLILGTASMPGYRDAYGYSPSYVDPGPVVVRSVFDPVGTFLIVIGLFVVIAIVIRLAL